MFLNFSEALSSSHLAGSSVIPSNFNLQKVFASSFPAWTTGREIAGTIFHSCVASTELSMNPLLTIGGPTFIYEQYESLVIDKPDQNND